ncbi:unnamed protein product, partial [uncultured bacterium]
PPSIAHGLLELMIQAGFPIEKRGKSFAHRQERRLKIGWFSIRCGLAEINSGSVLQLNKILTAASADGLIFKFYWTDGIVEPELAAMHGWELVDRVRDSGLGTEQYEISLLAGFTSWDALEAFRSLGTPTYEQWIAVGEIKLIKKKAKILVLPSPEGYRFSVHCRKDLSEEEISKIESILGVEFNRTPHIDEESEPGEEPQTYPKSTIVATKAGVEHTIAVMSTPEALNGGDKVSALDAAHALEKRLEVVKKQRGDVTGFRIMVPPGTVPSPEILQTLKDAGVKWDDIVKYLPPD